MLFALLLSWQMQLTKETRFWEAQMGLPKHEIVFEAMPKFTCGEYRLDQYLGPEGVAFQPVFVYTTAKRCSWFYSPSELALHETCHAQMKHLNHEKTRDEQEAEVHTCMGWYRGRR